MLEVNPDALAIAARSTRNGRRKGRAVRCMASPCCSRTTSTRTTDDDHCRIARAAAVIPPQSSSPKSFEAGAVILGKTNLVNGPIFEATAPRGWSGRGGQTNNPYALDRNPGSSPVQRWRCRPSLRGGHWHRDRRFIVSPSSLCGIVGVKPTVGLVSRSGIIPISHTQDTAGPMTRSVRDAAVLLGALTGIDPRDSATEQSRGKSERDYTRFLDPNGLRGARIGVARRFFRFGGLTEKLIEGALEAMKHAGAIIVDPADDPALGRYGSAEREVMLYEFKAGLNAYLASLGPKAPVKTLKEVIEFNERNKEKELPTSARRLSSSRRKALTEKAYSTRWNVPPAAKGGSTL